MTHEILPDVKDMILEFLLVKPVLHSAAQSVGVSPLLLQRELDRDEEFALHVEEATKIGLGAAESAAWDRAVDGVTHYVLDKGKPVMVIDEVTGQSVQLIEKRYSDKMLDLILKSKMPEVYGERAKLEIEGGSVLIAPAATDLDTFRDMLAGHKENMANGDDTTDGIGDTSTTD